MKWLALVLVAMTQMGCINGCDRGYSEGDRTGIVTKLSNKGVVNKSWEGELNLGGMTQDANDAMIPNVWKFTIVAPVVVPQVQEAMGAGKRITLHYVQWFQSPIFTMDTDYEVVEVRR